MTTIKLFTRTLVPTLALMFALTACGGGDGADKKAGKKDAGKQAKVDEGDKTKDTGKEVDAAEGGEPEADVPALDPKVEKAVTLANAVAADPGKADSILEEAGMDRESFQKLLYEIAQDPELSKSYAIAREA